MSEQTLPANVGSNDALGPNARAETLQGGMTNAQLAEEWRKKLPGVAPTDKDLTGFALGVEVGFARARDLERQDWSRVHHALAKHKAHPGRTDDHLADVIDRELKRLNRLLAEVADKALTFAESYEMGVARLVLAQDYMHPEQKRAFNEAWALKRAERLGLGA